MNTHELYGDECVGSVAVHRCGSLTCTVFTSGFDTHKRVSNELPKLCEREGCTKQALSGGTPHCIS